MTKRIWSQELLPSSLTGSRSMTLNWTTWTRRLATLLSCSTLISGLKPGMSMISTKRWRVRRRKRRRRSSRSLAPLLRTRRRSAVMGHSDSEDLAIAFFRDLLSGGLCFPWHVSIFALFPWLLWMRCDLDTLSLYLLPLSWYRSWCYVILWIVLCCWGFQRHCTVLFGLLEYLGGCRLMIQLKMSKCSHDRFCVFF